ncbi:cyclin-dependent kinase F-4-like protein [Tanacetum coccineum]
MENLPNIVNVKEIFYERGFLFVVFEYMEGNLSQLMEQQQDKPLLETKIREMYFQLFQDAIKIGDLGLAREMNDCAYTDYVITRSYRAPGALLGSQMYDYVIDIWAMDAIMAELFTHKPLFQEFHGMQFSNILPTTIPDLVNLVSGLISWNPCKRPAAMEAL